MLRLLCSCLLFVPLLHLTAVDHDSPLSVFADARDDVPDHLTRHSRQEIMGLARQLDTYVSDNLKVQGIKPHPRISDAVFLRRVYMDIAGRQPSYEEAQGFLKNDSSHKRYDLVDQLLNSRAYASHHFNYWADILRVKSRLNGGVPGRPYIDYIKQSMIDNKKYDDFVYELLTAEGSAWDEGNGATGYYIRDAGMTEDNMANTVQVFLGTRVACAQCHDHPFDKWKRRDFLEMTAFTSGVNARAGGLRQTRGVRKILGKDMKTDPELRRALRTLSRGIAVGVQDRARGTIKVPKDYQYNDLKPGEVVKAHTIFGDQISLGNGDKPRTVYAEWLTSPDNPRFTTVISNRMWKKAMGMGLIEPVDNMMDDSKPSNELLMAFLNQTMRKVDYDLKQFQRMLYYSETYQREAWTDDWNPDQVYHFPGPILRRVSAEQLWDSLLTIIMPAVDERPGPDAGMDYYEVFERLKNMTAEELVHVARVTAETETRRKELFIKTIKPLRAEVNALRKSGKDKRLLQQKQRKLGQLWKQHNALKDGFRYALGLAVDDGGMNMMSMEGANYKKKQKRKADPRWRGFNNNFVRASELRMPMNQGHFLRQFGQSDREQIQNANRDASVTQVLNLLNGFTQQQVLHSRSKLMKTLLKAESADERIDIIFLSILSRHPTDSEQKMARQGVQQHHSQFYGDLTWALVNSNEFLFIQ